MADPMPCRTLQPSPCLGTGPQCRPPSRARHSSLTLAPVLWCHGPYRGWSCPDGLEEDEPSGPSVTQMLGAAL